MTDVKTEPEISSEPAPAKTNARFKIFAEKLGLSEEEVKNKGYSLRKLKKMVVQNQYNSKRDERKKKNKEKRKLQRQNRKLTGELRPKIVKMCESSNKMCLAIDLSFGNYMNIKETRKLIKQIQRCYSINRRHSSPCQFYLTSCSTEFKEELCRLHEGFDNWDINCTDQHYSVAFKEHLEIGKLVFLSSDSTETLPDSDVMKEISGSFAYVIGGLVDHNVHKGLTKGLADEKNIKTAKLPIDEYVALSTSKVLTVNHGKLIQFKGEIHVISRFGSF